MNFSSQKGKYLGDLTSSCFSSCWIDSISRNMLVMSDRREELAFRRSSRSQKCCHLAWMVWFLRLMASLLW